METADQQAYLSAVNCLLTTESKLKQAGEAANMTGLQTRYDDFVYTHQVMTPTVHFVAQFLPWHRLFVWAYETALRDECGYTGTQPYWDWNLDVPPRGEFLSSPLWTDFGGNGEDTGPTTDFTIDSISHMKNLVKATVNAGITNDFTTTTSTGGGCVTDGYFANIQITLGPYAAYADNPRCLSRDMLPDFAATCAGDDQILAVMDATSFAGVMNNINLPHEAGHGGVGGYTGDVSYQMHNR
jgi:tyrosinase